jgi:hypothetical protein
VNHDELVLTAALAKVNQQIARYVLRVLDNDRGLTEYTVPLHEVQHSLGMQLVQVGQALIERARNGLAVEGTMPKAQSQSLAHPDQ